MSAQSSIRIIGGKWRSRKVSFKTKDVLRPTPDRVRETLFNWLAPYIVDATCLDLYAGSGVLGFEALSRGAKEVIAVEVYNANMVQIEQNKELLNASNIMVLNKDVLAWLQGRPMTVDIVFIDPPYNLDLLPTTFKLLDQQDWIKPDGFIYFEDQKPISEEDLPGTWSIWRQAKAGNIHYYLARKQNV